MYGILQFGFDVTFSRHAAWHLEKLLGSRGAILAMIPSTNYIQVPHSSAIWLTLNCRLQLGLCDIFERQSELQL